LLNTIELLFKRIALSNKSAHRASTRSFRALKWTHVGHSHGFDPLDGENTERRVLAADLLLNVAAAAIHH